MKKLYILITVLIISSVVVQAKTLVRVKAIGSSPKGQYVAFEEFGYQNGRKLPFSKIRVMNVWKNKYVETPVVIVGAKEDDRLNQVRARAKQIAEKKLQKFNITI